MEGWEAKKLSYLHDKGCFGHTRILSVVIDYICCIAKVIA